MKIFINRHMTGLDGKKLKEFGKSPEAGDTSEERLGVLLIEGLIRDLPSDQQGAGAQKLARWKLANKIQGEMNKGKSPDYSIEMRVEDVNMIKNRLGQFLPTVILGPAFMAIDPENEADEPSLKVVD